MKSDKNRESILELAGILSDEEADKLRKHIKERRAASRKRMDKIRELLKDI